MRKFDSVLLIAFGGPTRAEEIRPFLANVARGRGIPAQRLEEVAHHYELIGGGSPLNDLTFRQARALEERLRAEGSPLPVFVGMRNWHPYLRETLQQMADSGRSCAVGVILSPQQNEAGWDRYVRDVADARAAIGAGAPAIEIAPFWGDDALFIEAVAARVAAALAEVDAGLRQDTHVIFTAHSIPVRAAAGSPYAAQFEAAARRAAERLEHAHWSLAYQSRSGNPGDPWLEPDILDWMRSLHAAKVRSIVVAPIGFVCDHVEVLYDLDVQAKHLAQALGLSFARAQTVNDHPAFIRLLARAVLRFGLGREPQEVTEG